MLLCTASILNITLIAIDRYFSITRALEYLKFRSEMMVTMSISVVWFISAMVSLPLLVWTPKNFQFKPLVDGDINFGPEDKETMDLLPANTTKELAHVRCSVSPRIVSRVR